MGVIGEEMGRLYVEAEAAPAPSSGSVDAGVVEAIADWCDALHGDLPLQDAFSALAAGLGAEAGMLVRTQFSDFRPSRIAVWDRNGARNASPLSASFADGRFGPHIARPRTASVWLASLADDADDADPGLECWQTRRGLTEFAALILSGGPGARDHIELHFRASLGPAMQATLAAVLPTMARTWANRQVGFVTRTVVNHRATADLALQQSVPAMILGTSNPARLSRAEFRVCLLLSRGLSVTGVAEELTVSEATVRSHLRSIYAKTDTSGLAELVFALLRSKPAGPPLSDLRCA